MNFHCLLVCLIALNFAGGAVAANSPASQSPLLAPVATPAALPATPTPASGFSPQAPESFDPSKFGTLTTSTLPVENGKRLVGKVNGRPLTWDDFFVMFEVSAAELSAKYPNAREGLLAAMSAPVFDNLVLTELNREFAEKHNLGVSGAEAKRKAGEILMRAAGAEKQALQRLTQEQILTIAKDALIREKVEKFIGDKATSVPPTLEEIEAVGATAAAKLTTSPIETLRARHIVVRATPDMTEFAVKDARARAEEILEKVTTGGLEFAQAARQYSQDRFTAYLGGNVGYFTRGTMFKEFEDAAFGLQPGQVSGIVRTPVGFHIIQVTERYPDNLRIVIDELRAFHAVEAWKREALQSAAMENYLVKGQ